MKKRGHARCPKPWLLSMLRMVGFALGSFFLVACSNPLEDLRVAEASLELPASFTRGPLTNEVEEDLNGSASFEVRVGASVPPDVACSEAKAALEAWTASPVLVFERQFSTEYCVAATWSPPEHDGVDFAGFAVSAVGTDPSAASIILALREERPYPPPTTTPEPRPTATEPFVYLPVLAATADLMGLRVADRWVFEEYAARLWKQGETGLVDCMDRQGFDYPPQRFEGASERLPTTVDREFVALHGFGIAAPIETNLSLTPSGRREGENFYKRALSRSELAAFEAAFGVEGDSGCVAVSRADVDRFTAVFDELGSALLATQKNLENDERSLALDAKWSDCMEVAGYDFALREIAEVSIGQRLGEIMGAPGAESVTNSLNGRRMPANEQTSEAVAVLIDEERALALASFDCEAETEADRLAIEAEYNEQFFADHGAVIDEILGSF